MYESERLKKRRQRLGREQPIDYRERRQKSIANLQERLSYVGVKVPEQPKQAPGTGTRILRALSAPGRYTAALVSEATNKSPGINLSRLQEKARSQNFNYGFKDVLAEHGAKGKTGAALGFVGDVLLDPLNLVTGGAGAVARTVGKLGLKAAPKIGMAGGKLKPVPGTIARIAERKAGAGKWEAVHSDDYKRPSLQGFPVKDEDGRLLRQRLPETLKPIMPKARPEDVTKAQVTLGKRKLVAEAAKDKGGLKFAGQTIIPGSTLKAPFIAVAKVPAIKKAGQAIASTGTYQDLTNLGQAVKRLFSTTAAMRAATERYAQALGKHAGKLEILKGKQVDVANPLRMAQWIVDEYGKHRNLARAEVDDFIKGVQQVFGNVPPADAKKVLHYLEGHPLDLVPASARMEELRRFLTEREDEAVAYLSGGHREAVEGIDNIYDEIRKRGGIAIHPQAAFYTEWVQSVPRNIRQQLSRADGIPLDEMADELGLTARELLEALSTGRLTKRARAADFTDVERYRPDARRYLEKYDPEYKQALDELWDLETEALENVAKGTDEHLIPVINQAREMLRKIARREVDSGLLPHMIDNYVPHIRNPKIRLTAEDKKKLAESFGPETAENLASDDPHEQMKGIATVFEARRLAYGPSTPGQQQMVTPNIPVNQGAQVARMFNPHALQRHIRATVKEINELVGKEFFTEDAAVALAVRGARSIQAEHAYQFTVAALSKWGITVTPETLINQGKKIPQGFSAYRISVAPNGYVKLVRLTLPEVEALRNAELTRKAMKTATAMEPLPAFDVPFMAIVPDEFARVLNRMHNAFYGDEDFKAALGWYDRFLGWWRAQATVLRPGYHLRNATGNFWNNWVAGIGARQMGFYALAAQLQRNPEMVIETPIGRLTREQLWQIMTEKGVIGTTFAGAELGRQGYHAIEAAVGRGRGSLNPLSSQFIGIRLGRNVGTTIEDNAKIAHFLAKLWEWRDPDAAALSVKRFLFDYYDVTSFERNVMKRIFPFYIWLSRNTPLQIEMLWRQPGKAAKVQDIQALSYNLTGDQAPSLEEQPPWMQGLIPLRVGQEGTQQTYWNPAFPIADIGMLATHEGSPFRNIQETARNIISAMSPGIKAPFEIAANRSFFSYPQQAFAEKPGDVGKSPGRYLLEQVPTFKGIADAVAPLNPETPVSSRILSPLGLKPLWLDTEKVAEGRERNYYDLLQAVRRQAEEQGIEVPTVREIEKSGYVSERLKRRRKRLGYQ